MEAMWIFPVCNHFSFPIIAFLGISVMMGDSEQIMPFSASFFPYFCGVSS